MNDDDPGGTLRRRGGVDATEVLLVSDANKWATDHDPSDVVTKAVTDANMAGRKVRRKYRERWYGRATELFVGACAVIILVFAVLVMRMIWEKVEFPNQCRQAGGVPTPIGCVKQNSGWVDSGK